MPDEQIAAKQNEETLTPNEGKQEELSEKDLDNASGGITVTKQTDCSSPGLSHSS